MKLKAKKINSVHGYVYCQKIKASGYDGMLPVHRIVATAWCPNPEGKPFVDHIDSNRRNNRASNLRWVTR